MIKMKPPSAILASGKENVLSTLSATKTILWKVFPFHAAAWEAAAEPIQQLLNTDDEDLKDERTELWRNAMQVQLNSIAVTSALVAAVASSAFTWPTITTPGVSWVVRAAWYSSLLLSLASICTATQQSIVLSRLATNPQGSVILRMMLGKSKHQGSNGQLEPRRLQLYIWQVPVSLLSGGVYFFLAGLTVMVWNLGQMVDLNWDQDDTKVVTVFMIVLGFVVFSYVLSTAGLYNRIRVVTREFHAQ
ncbi:hypothetical protein F5Y13DRAFT_158970 [Hypoxylon sp. FL1857]|nr:hypothetical protein F5Y13DRAFT_158970 [Hypoxylon sp. FL1857]